MNSIQIKKLKMYLAIRVLLRANPAILAKLPNAEEYLTALDAAIVDIQNNSTQQDAGTDAIKTELASSKAKAVSALDENARKLKAYASHEGDKVLMDFCTVTANKLGKMEDVKLLQYGKTLYDKQNALLENLTKYSVSAESQEGLLDAITQYEVLTPQFSKAKSDYKQVKTLVTDGYKNADAIVAKLDIEVDMVRASDATFCNQYKTLRKVEYRAETNMLVGHVNDAKTGGGVPNATVSLELSESTNAAITKTTAEKGGFQLKSIEPGVYTVTVTKLGYVSQTQEITVTGDEPYSLEIKLLRAAQK